MTYRAWDVERRFSFRRGLAALIIAPLLPSLIFMLGMGLSDMPMGMFVLILLIAEFWALVFGLPAIFVLRNKIRPRVVWAFLYGGLTVGLPFSLFMLLPAHGLNAWTGGIPTVVDGRLTWFGLQIRMMFVAGGFALGALGGAIFWFIAVGWESFLGGRQKLTDD